MEDVTNKLSVQVPFILIGKSKEIPAIELPLGWSNSNTLEMVKEKVAFHFGSRAMHVVNEDDLLPDNKMYPEFYAAGWFHTIDSPMTELVIISHGHTMESARRNLFTYVPDVPWNEVCCKV